MIVTVLFLSCYISHSLRRNEVNCMRDCNRRRGNKQDTYNRSLHVLARMRRTGATLTETAREEQIDPRTVRKYLKTELRGRGKPTKVDRRKRDMLVPTTVGNAPVTIRGSKQAS